MFPGALPDRFDTPVPAARARRRRRSRSPTGATSTLRVEVSDAAAGRSPPRWRHALRGAASRRRARPTPLPAAGDRLRARAACAARSPATCRATMTLDVGSTGCGRSIDVLGHGAFAGTYRRLDFDNVATTQHGTVQLPVDATAYAVTPLQLQWTARMRRRVVRLAARRRALVAVLLPARARGRGARAGRRAGVLVRQLARHQLWDAGARGQGITIAEIDTGVNACCPELAGRVLPGNDFGAAGGDGQIDRDSDAFGHGTAMASIMVGRPGSSASPGWRRTPSSCRSRCRCRARPTPAATTTCRRRSAGPPITARRSSACRSAARAPRPQTATACPADEQAAIFYAMRKGASCSRRRQPRRRPTTPSRSPGCASASSSVGAVDQPARWRLLVAAPVPHAGRAGRDIPSLGRVPEPPTPATAPARPPRSPRRHGPGLVEVPPAHRRTRSSGGYWPPWTTGPPGRRRPTATGRWTGTPPSRPTYPPTPLIPSTPRPRRSPPASARSTTPPAGRTAPGRRAGPVNRLVRHRELTAPAGSTSARRVGCRAPRAAGDARPDDRRPAAQPPAQGDRTRSAPNGPSPVHVDSNGMEWHEIHAPASTSDALSCGCAPPG